MLMNDRRLYRSRTDTMVGGVAAGLAAYLNTDPTLVRIGWAILAIITNGAGVLAYVVAWVLVPEEPAAAATAVVEQTTDPVTGEQIMPVATTEPATTTEPRGDGRAGIVVGVGLVIVGVWFLLREYLPDIDWSLIWPLVIVGIGALILVTSMRRRER